MKLGDSGLKIDPTDKIKKYAYWERLKVSEIVNQALREFFEKKKFTKQTMFTHNLGEIGFE